MPGRPLSLSALAALVAAIACGHAPAPAPSGPFGPSPPVTSTVSLDGLSGPVDMLRDTHGMVHIWAANQIDALRVEGYQMARDRSPALELVRRYAEGRVAELLGNVMPRLVDSDITMRTIGIARVAKQMYDALPADSEVKAWLDAFAGGVSQFYARLQSGDEALPKAMVGIPQSAYTPWTGADSLAIARLFAFELGYSADKDIEDTSFVNAARTAFPTGPRSGLLVDVVRFAPIDPTISMEKPGFPNDPMHTMMARTQPPWPTPRVSPELLESARGFVEAAGAIRDVFGRIDARGSNNWVVAPSRTATGHAMLANDPHLPLNAPPFFWMVQLEAPDAHSTGVVLPGMPGIMLGFGEHIAWGATTADYDVSDVYAEKLTPDGGAVVFGGESVPLERVHETIGISGSAPLEYDVLVVPHHGPIVPTIVNHRIVPPDPSVGALSVRWTGYQPTNETAAMEGIARAKSVDDFRDATRDFAIGAQNWVVADDAGNIFYTTQSQVPMRDKRAFTWDPKTFRGTLPCFVEPGDGTAEWTGQMLDEAYVPHEKNPSVGYVGTANNDQMGDTLDNDPSNETLPDGRGAFLGCWHDPGFRVGRIHRLIENVGHPMTLDDMAAIQGDARSAIGSRLAPVLVTAIEHAQAEAKSPGTHPDLTDVVQSARFQGAPIVEMHDLLSGWAASDYDTPAGVSLDDGSISGDAREAAASEATLVHAAWLMRMERATLGDELDAMHWLDEPAYVHMRVVMTYLLTADPKTLATFDPATGDSALFDDLTTPGHESRDERCVTSLLDAIDFLTAKLGADRSRWRWGLLHTVRFASIVPLWQSLSVPPTGDAVFPNGFPRHGDGYDIDYAEPDVEIPAKLSDARFDYGLGPSQRFVVDLDPGGFVARNVLPGGEVWDDTSAHFRDGAELWRRNQNHAVAHTHDDVAAAAEERVQYR